MPKSLSKLVAIGIVGGGLLAGAVAYSLIPRQEAGSGAAHDRRFPPGASDIDYNISRGAFGGWWNADFRISEADFVAYARERGWNLETLAEPAPFRTGLEPGALEVRTISDGLVYQSAIEDDGGHVMAVFDRSSGRAVIRSSAH